MDYYKLYELTPSPIADKVLVKKKYLQLSREHHPDFADNTDENSKEAALNISSQVNKAYKIFSDPALSIQYFLQYKGVITEDEKYSLPNDFLMDMMDLNEMLEDAKADNNNEELISVKQRIEGVEQEMNQDMEELIAHDVMDGKELQQLKSYYYKIKYIHRILEGIS